MALQLQIIHLSGVFADKNIFQIDVPTTAGPIAINEGHVALVGDIKPGIVTITNKKGDSSSHLENLAVYEGTVEVLNNVVTILVDDVDTPDEISEAEAQKAFDRAKDLTSKAGKGVELAEAHSMMDRSAVRLQLASLKRRRKS